jgi:lipoprotein-anchoring transpeptidase ErfK/SrfK
MWRCAAQLTVALALLAGAPPAARSGEAQQAHRKSTAAQRKPARRMPAPPRLPCGNYLSFQVLLDRQGFSPGQIDAKPGDTFSHALAAMQSAHNLPPTGQPDCDTWHALGGDSAGSTVTTYFVSEEDVKGPFTKKIPRRLIDEAALDALDYTSPLERLGEKFHASPALLRQMNVGIAIAPGASMSVPAVTPFDAASKPAPDPAAGDVQIQVSRADSALRAMRSDGTLVFFAPVTTGSAHDPLPTGDWKVTGVQWRPKFHYNPNLFWDAKPGDTKATIKPGPNNPVGVAWIALTLEHYGIHGTPEPGNIGRTESHGCVRLTNWDVARLVSLVKPGTPVHFQ